jgi:hypothetical protein
VRARLKKLSVLKAYKAAVTQLESKTGSLSRELKAAQSAISAGANAQTQEQVRGRSSFLHELDGP